MLDQQRHLICSACGKDLGPAARHLRAARVFNWPMVYKGGKGETVCYSCWYDQHNPAPDAHLETEFEDRVSGGGYED